MIIEQTLLYLDKPYQILQVEQEYIIHPAALGLLPLNETAFECTYTCSLQIKDYRLYLDKLTIDWNKESDPELFEPVMEGQDRLPDHLPVSYNGAILIAADKGKDYQMKGLKDPCFSYQSVYELIFEDGVLITTVDQSKAMLRIRKNLELGLRSLTKNRDIRCIKRFMNDSFVGDYRPFLINYNRMRYIKEMKKDYQVNNNVKLITSSK